MRSLRGAGVAAVCALTLTVLGTSGCSSKGKVKEPTKLAVIANPGVKPVVDWSRRVGLGSKDNKFLDGSFLFAGAEFSNLRLTIEADALYAGSLDGDVFALNPQSGATIWRSATKARVISGPTVFDDKVLVGTLDGDAIALQRADGKPLWRFHVDSELIAAPVGSGNMVIVRSVDGREFGVSARDGTRVWAFDRTVPNLTLRGQSEPVIIGTKVFTGMDNGKLAALNVDDGVVGWEQNISVPTGRGDLDRLTDIDADLLAGSDGLFVVTYGNDIALLDPLSGDSKWRRSIKSYNSMAGDDQRLYVTDDDGVLWCIANDTGAAIWKQEAVKYRHLSPPAIFNGYIVAGDYKGYLHWFEPVDGKLVARTRVGSDAIAAAPVGDGKRLFVTDVTGHVTAYSIPSSTGK